jgi:PqqA peptide cyclase
MNAPLSPVQRQQQADTPARPAEARDASLRNAVPPPMALLAELTHRCPLACPYCSNPLELTRAGEELSTAEWIDVFAQAADLGVLHLHLSGGEPASRRDLVELTRAAAGLGLYTNLITSGVGLTQARIGELAEAGLDHVQLSIQGTTPEMADRVGGYRGGYERKMAVAGWVTASGIPLTVNAVCHKQNMDELDAMIDLAVTCSSTAGPIATAAP